MKFKELIRSLSSLSPAEKTIYRKLDDYLESGDCSEVKGLVKQKKAALSMSEVEVSPQVAKCVYPCIKASTEDEEITAYIKRLNDIIQKKAFEDTYTEFSTKAHEVIPKLIAMNIIGLEHIKKAAAVQLFATPSEPVHMLLLGDPGTGKTDILRSAAQLSPISQFGLGSGTTGVGLTVTVSGDEVRKGLLPLAHKGTCAIDELNLMKERDRASLYNAMEKGFITYDKAGKHYKFESQVKVIATANPKGDQFAGWTLATLKKQLPFDSALLTRFHLVFLIRKPDVKQFVEISKNILRKKTEPTADERFIHSYIEHGMGIEVVMPSDFERQVVDFVAEVKKNEHKYLIEVSPRLVLGFVRLAKASARMGLRKEVNQQDIDLVKDIVTEGLKLR